MLDIVAWNVNGIRALPKTLKETLDGLNADIICFQETKIDKSQLDGTLGIVNGYNAYYSSCKKKSGYAGVAIYCREPIRPVRAEEGLSYLCGETDCVLPSDCIFPEFSQEDLQDLDTEGRAVMIQLKTKCCGGQDHQLTIISVYCPRGNSDSQERVEFKKNFHQLLERKAQSLRTPEHHVVIAGDLNISHRAIDHCDPDSKKISKSADLKVDEKNTSSGGATYSGTIHLDFVSVPARQWINKMLVPWQRDPVEKDNEQIYDFVDTFRRLHPTTPEAYSCWCSRTGARQTNYGNRIDYILSDSELAVSLVHASVEAEVLGSDHCPVRARFDNLTVVSGPKCPSLCSSFLPQCTGRQLTIAHFFAPADKSLSNYPTSRKRGASALSKPVQTKLGFVNKQPKLSTSPASQSGTPDESELTTSTATPTSTVDAWKAILRGPGKAPLCPGHELPCLLRTVRKDSANKGRQFWICCRPEGHASNKEARCDFFRWISK